MSPTDRAKYAELVEIAARCLAFIGITDRETPREAYALIVDAAALRQGGAAARYETEVDDPIRDAVIDEVNARMYVLQLEMLARLNAAVLKLAKY